MVKVAVFALGILSVTYPIELPGIAFLCRGERSGHGTDSLPILLFDFFSNCSSISFSFSMTLRLSLEAFSGVVTVPMILSLTDVMVVLAAVFQFRARKTLLPSFSKQLLFRG